MPGPSSSTVTVSQRWSRWPVIEIERAWRAAFDTRLSTQRLNAAGPHGDDRRAVERDVGAVAVALAFGLQLVEEGGHVGRRRGLAGIAAREREIGFEHPRHLVDVLLHRLDLGTVVADQRQLELEAGQDGAQVVRDAGEHRGALLHRALDAGLHLDEGVRRAAHLAARRADGSSAPRGPCRSFRRRRRAAGSGGSGCAGTGSRRSAARVEVPTIQSRKISEFEA